MSWIIKNYLKNYYNLKSLSNINTNVFDDLVSIEKSIDFLRNSGKFTKAESDIINKLFSGYTVTDICKANNVSIQWVLRAINKISKKIEKVIGDLYNDESYIYDFSKRNSLTPQQIKKLEDFIYNEKRTKVHS